MRVGIYAEVAKGDLPTGIGRHVLHLAEELGHLDRENLYLLYYQRDLGRGGAGLPQGVETSNVRPRPVAFPRDWIGEHPSLWWKAVLPLAVAADRVDIFHGPNHFLPDIPRRKAVVTIHDLAFLKMDLYPPEMTEALRRWTERSARRAGRVIAVSGHTGRDVEALLGVGPDRIRVVPNGCHAPAEGQVCRHREAEPHGTPGLPGPFVLFVGTLNRRKNVPFLLRAFDRLRREHGLPHRLVLAGQRDSAAEEVDRLIDELGLGDQVVVTDYIEPQRLSSLYATADLLVFPSRYEGSAMAVREAMLHGVPVVAADTSCIREEVGDAAILVPLDDVDALTSAMRRVLTESTLRRSLVERGRTLAGQFTWKRCAEQTLSVYRELHAECRRGG